MNHNKQLRMNTCPPGMENRLGVGQPSGPVSGRCRAQHDVPYSLRCVHDGAHEGKHRDKRGDEWE